MTSLDTLLAQLKLAEAELIDARASMTSSTFGGRSRTNEALAEVTRLEAEIKKISGDSSVIKVFKYRLNGPGTTTEVDAASLNAPVLVAEQRGRPHIWIEALPSVTLKRRFLVVGTGWDIPEQAKHVGSYQSLGGEFIWHVYELHGRAA